MFKRILVPLDGSRRAESALPLAARLARVASGHVYLIRAVPTPESYFWGAPQAVAVLPDVIEEERKAAHAYLQVVATSPGLKDLAVSCQLENGEPEGAILSMVEEQHIDLVVICSHGATGFKRWVLGSVAHKVARHCSVPVLILHQREEQPFASWNNEGGQARVLVPLDGSPLAEEVIHSAVTLALALAAPNQAALHLLSVLPARETDPRPHTESDAQVERAEAYLKQVEARVRSSLASEQNIMLTSSVVLENDVASAVVDFAQRGIPRKGERGCDVIAMATHGRGAFSRWIMGSVTERVLDTSRVPLLIVRPEKIPSA